MLVYRSVIQMQEGDAVLGDLANFAPEKTGYKLMLLAP